MCGSRSSSRSGPAPDRAASRRGRPVFGRLYKKRRRVSAPGGRDATPLTSADRFPSRLLLRLCLRLRGAAGVEVDGGGVALAAQRRDVDDDLLLPLDGLRLADVGVLVGVLAGHGA